MPGESCPVCGETFAGPGALHDHVWGEHGACHYCGEQYEDTERLYKHWLLTHEGDLSERDRTRATGDVGEITMSDRIDEQGISGIPGGLSRRAVLAGAGTAVVAAGGGVAYTILDSGSNSNLESAPVPPNPEEYTYAVTGKASAGATITYVGNWKCPFCASFSNGFFSTLVSEYVEPGDLRMEFRNLAYIDDQPFLGVDAPAAGHAGLAVWNTDPENYWPFHHYVFKNQPPEGQQWATADRLATMAEEAGVSDPDAVRQAVQNQAYEEQLRETAQMAADQGVRGTPSLLIDGEVVSPTERQQVRDRIDQLV